MDLSTQALLWGLASAVSLPVGAALGLALRPGSRVSSAFMAFGAGALLFALSIELLGHVPHYVSEMGNMALYVAVAGAIVGGLVFDTLNQMLNNRGAFLRNLSNAKDFVARTKKARAKRMLRRLSRVKSLQNLPPEDIAELVKRVVKERYRDGELIYRADDPEQEIHFIRRGRVALTEQEEDGGERVVKVLDPNDSFGELSDTNERGKFFSARALGEVDLYTLEDDELEDALEESPRLRRAIETLARAHIDDSQLEAEDRQGRAWRGEAEGLLDEINIPIDDDDIRHESSNASRMVGAAMAIWLGIAIDAIPESLVIGTLATGPEGISMAFVAGVFLANMPEAMSSAVSMRNNGLSRARILLMWGSLCLLTGIGAYLGAALFPPEPEGRVFLMVLGIEALAAGAMLTMIAETMLPEAFEQGGAIVGLATLCGFLVALSVAALY